MTVRDAARARGLRYQPCRKKSPAPRSQARASTKCPRTIGMIFRVIPGAGMVVKTWVIGVKKSWSGIRLARHFAKPPGDEASLPPSW